jgi:hypothetical protein
MMVQFMQNIPFIQSFLGDACMHVDGLWLTQDMPSLIPQFIHKIGQATRRTSIGLSQVTFSRGIPTREDPTDLMAVYLAGERRSLLGIF